MSANSIRRVAWPCNPCPPSDAHRSSSSRAHETTCPTFGHRKHQPRRADLAIVPFFKMSEKSNVRGVCFDACMTRRRMLARQLQTSWLDSTGTKPKSARGGKRRGAGRPPKGVRAGSPHRKRPRLRASTPVHVTLRVVSVIGNLRKRLMYDALRWATLALAAKHEDCRIVCSSKPTTSRRSRGG